MVEEDREGVVARGLGTYAWKVAALTLLHWVAIGVFIIPEIHTKCLAPVDLDCNILVVIS